MLAVYFFRGGFERVGAIRLSIEPDSRSTLQRMENSLQNFAESVSRVFKASVHWISVKVSSIGGFVRSGGRRRSGGYQPVRSMPTSSFDQTRYEDNSLMDLEEY